REPRHAAAVEVRARPRILAGWEWVAGTPARYLPLVLIAVVVSAIVLVAMALGGTTTRGTPASAEPHTPGVRSTSGSVAGAGSLAGQGHPSAAVPNATSATTPAWVTESASAGPRVDDPLTGAQAPREDPLRVVQALSDLRARAWQSLDRLLLARVSAPDSPAATTDRRAFDRAIDAGLHYSGLEFRVRSARASSPGGSGSDRVAIAAVIDSSAFTIEAADGSMTSVPPAPGARVLMVVDWDGARWRVFEVTQH
ncbi:hypothetical protein, partial [Nostocoides sp.]|uniref:hypothetical protein n=2 Tax=Nostocoides sp. TaxID=1917966 RepID=UPI003BB11334